MKTLYLLRHARAEDYAGGRGDHARELTDAGRAQAREAGAALADAGIELILASSASRALQTARGLGLDVPIEASDELYNAGSLDILDELAALDDRFAVVAVVAHAPGIPTLAHRLASSDSDAEAIARIDSHFPPATLVGLHFEGAWHELADARLFVSRLG